MGAIGMFHDILCLLGPWEIPQLSSALAECRTLAERWKVLSWEELWLLCPSHYPPECHIAEGDSVYGAGCWTYCDSTV